MSTTSFMMPRQDGEHGGSAVEYGLLIAGIAGLTAAVVFLFGSTVRGLFETSCVAVNSGSNGHVAMVC